MHVRPWLFPPDCYDMITAGTVVVSSTADATSLVASCTTTKTTTSTTTLSTALANTGVPFISKGDLRVGSLEAMSGTYARWNHLACWRVPSRVWQGLDVAEDDHETVARAKVAHALHGMDQVGPPDGLWGFDR